ncbi:aminoglycoside adenylyltransferase domain-containing protein [Paenibacillus solani]|uniref:Spectinomycin 9-adenylyltransferase n=1 Tax=Paenibacillus solani TaxID=1705565 RepID=A0A0M1P2M8_9BACL|nr:aminoglycoside adenylyltransferase domain-containing protein [Paenibacillus solani]KOR88314.1 DNA polymerase [Paenibacillus solani]
MDTQMVLDQTVELFKEELHDNLIGIYLHGSLAMGCFHPEGSDIDLIIVAAEKLSHDHMRRLVEKIMALEDTMANRQGLELSLVLESSLKELVYPPLFELHYSAFHRERYLTDDHYICGGFADADLVAHYTVIYHRGIVLYGKPIREVFMPVDRQHYVQAILNDVEHAVQDIAGSPTYYTLNLCRVLYYLKENVVSSKKEGGEWGLCVLPSEYHSIIERALDAYRQGDQSHVDSVPDELIPFAKYMLEEIHRVLD